MKKKACAIFTSYYVKTVVNLYNILMAERINLGSLEIQQTLGLGNLLLRHVWKGKTGLQ